MTRSPNAPRRSGCGPDGIRDVRVALLLAVAFIVLALLGDAVSPVEQPPGPNPSGHAVASIGRPYTAGSVWNTPIGASPEIDARSAELLDSIRIGPTRGAITSDPTQYTYPVYEVDAQTPRQDIPCVEFKCTVVTEGGVKRVAVLENVPIPADAQPSAGSDGSMIIVDTETGTEYDLWMVEHRADGTTSVANASTYNVRWLGTPEEYGSRGAGVPYLAGLVRHWEIQTDRLEHAIAFAYPNVAIDHCVWPASKTDGTSTLANALPEGARLQLDPSLSDDDFEAMGLTRAGRIIAHALQRYGMIVIDVSARPKIMIEDLFANPYATGSWSRPPTQLTDTTIAAIPLEAFRVLALPEGWADGSSAGRHGNCAR